MGLKTSDYKTLKAVFEKGGPDENEMKILDRMIREAQADEMEQIKQMFEPVLKADTLMGHSYRKPYGYAGDFMIIEKLYTKFVTGDEKYRKWDEYFQTMEAGQAVRNRKAFFKSYLKSKLKYNETLEVLILGSGPATDVYEFLSENKDAEVTFDLLDIDNAALEYSKAKNKEFSHKINFIKGNVIRYSTEKKYDLIWSAGLFDYLKDKAFVFVIKRFINNLKADGNMLIGNFAPQNPTRAFMDHILEWVLIYRTEDDLKRLAVEAGIAPDDIKIMKEPLGINLFMEIAKPEEQAREEKAVEELSNSAQ